ncbi:hypothetical protein Dimus_008729 [Dionaea muscipula]
MPAEESTDWLPSDWKTKAEVRHGRKIKFYVNMKSGLKCYSKPAVLRLLKSESIKTERSQSPSVHSKLSSGEKDDQDWKQTPELLPGSWSMEWKIRKSGPKMGSKYRCYTEPSTGRKFYSKAEVSRYLMAKQQNTSSSVPNNEGISNFTSGNGPISSCSDHKPLLEKPTVTRREEILNGKKVVIETALDEDLPPGWTKEIRTKWTKGKMRRDSFYINPTADYIFLSKVDALRYVESGQLSRLAKKRKSGSIDGDSTGSKISPPSPNKKKTTEGAARKCLFSAGEPMAKADRQSEKKGTLKAMDSLASPSKDVSEEGDSVDGAIGKGSVDTSSQISKSKTRNQKQSKEPLSALRRQSSRLHAADKAETVVSSLPFEHAVGATRRTSPKARPVPSSGSIPHEFTGEEKYEQLDIHPPKEPAVPPAAADHSSGEPVKTKSPRKRVKPQRDPINKESPSAIENNYREPVSSNVKPIQDHPVAEEPPASSVDANGNENESERPESPFCCTAIWSDPCLEFAYKTLTGALPLDALDDNLAIQDYVDHQLRTSSQSNGNLNLNLNASDIGASSCPSNDVWSELDLAKRADDAQPTEAKLAPPLPGDGDDHSPNGYVCGLPKSS